jgi:hypothetical protein
MIRLSKLATPNVRFALSPGKALSLRIVMEHDCLTIAVDHADSEPSEFTQFFMLLSFSPSFRDGDRRAMAFGFLANGGHGNASLIFP